VQKQIVTSNNLNVVQHTAILTMADQ